LCSKIPIPVGIEKRSHLAWILIKDADSLPSLVFPGTTPPLLSVLFFLHYKGFR
jgi:hypothetical protein